MEETSHTNFILLLGSLNFEKILFSKKTQKKPKVVRLT